MYTNVHMFFTTWVVLLVLLHKFTHPYIDLFYLTFVVMMSGLYISLVHPQRYSFWMFNEKYDLKTYDRFIIVDMFFHVGAFIFISSLYKGYYVPSQYDFKFIAAMLMILVYALIINQRHVYQVGMFEMMTVVVVASLIYLLLFSQK